MQISCLDHIQAAGIKSFSVTVLIVEADQMIKEPGKFGRDRIRQLRRKRRKKREMEEKRPRH